MEPHTLPGIREIREAQRAIEGVACRTPVVDTPGLSKRFERQIYLKLENFQSIRVFKIRGAFNKISRVKEKDIVAVSSGNHGMAVAFVSREFGKKCTVILPENPVQEKADAIEEYGAEVIKYGKYHSDREAKAEQLLKERNAAFVHPFNDPLIIAGQGTCGVEIAEQLPEVDSVLVPVGGGGLIAGIAIAIKSLRPNVKVFGVEPTGAPKLQAALNARRVVSVEAPHSIADGLIPPSIGDLTYEACSKYVDGVFTVTDEEIITAMKTLIKDARIFPEPSGSAGMAALIANRDVDRLGSKVLLVISGGNVSQKLLSQVLAS